MFLGTAPLLAVTAYSARYSPQSLAWLLGAFLIYLVGSVGATMAFNVPRNNRLASPEATSAEATAYWPVYLREWLIWNHALCIASLATAVVAMLAVTS